LRSPCFSFALARLFLFLAVTSWRLFLSSAEPNKNIVIIAIDDKSLQEIGRWPWERKVHTQLLNLLNQSKNKPAVIGMDIAFPEAMADINQDRELAKAIKKSGNVILPVEDIKFKLEKNQKIPQAQRLLEPISLLKNSAVNLGLVNLPPDPDNITRRIPLLIKKDNQYIESFSIAILREYFYLSPKIPSF
jgi:adenylate cyclase